mgnify:CR=1 FL=1
MTTFEKIRKDYKEHKEEWDEILKAATKAKYDACTKVDKDGKKRFDYLKMSEMYHSGRW